jgi:hypothetical protein
MDPIPSTFPVSEVPLVRFDDENAMHHAAICDGAFRIAIVVVWCLDIRPQTLGVTLVPSRALTQEQGEVSEIAESLLTSIASGVLSTFTGSDPRERPSIQALSNCDLSKVRLRNITEWVTATPSAHELRDSIPGSRQDAD